MEELLEKVGAFGRFQVLNLLIISSLSALTASTIYGTIFFSAYPKITCKYNAGHEGNDKLTDICAIKKNISDSSAQNIDPIFECGFDDTYYGKTIVTEWNLICDRKYLVSLTQTAYMFGTICGIFSGYFGDHFGRRKSSLAYAILLSITLCISQIIQIQAFNLSANAGYALYIVSQFFVGAFGYCLYISVYVLVLEITTNKYHTRMSMLLLFCYCFGEILIMIVAYLARDWRIQCWTITGISVFLSIFAYFLLPESPKWLITQKRYDEAEKVFRKIARLNGKEFKEEYLVLMKQNNDDDIENITKIVTSVSPTDEGASPSTKKSIESNQNFSAMLKQLLTPKKELLKFIFLVYIRMAVGMVYYGVGLGIAKLDDSINPYVIYTFQAISEMLGYTLSLINDRFGHRKMNMIYYGFAGIMCIIISFVPRTNETSDSKAILLDTILMVSLTAIGKCVVSASFNTCYVYTSEFYGTSIRNFALAVIACLGNIGSIIAPEINGLQDVWRPLPYLIFSLSSFIAFIVVFILPETKKHNSK